MSVSIMAAGFAASAFAQEAAGIMNSIWSRLSTSAPIISPNTLYYGEVTALSGTTITMSGDDFAKGIFVFGFGATAATTTGYMVDAANSTITKNGLVAATTDIVVGDRISVSGVLSGDKIAAKKIWVSANSAAKLAKSIIPVANTVNQNNSVSGQVIAVDNATITMNGRLMDGRATATTTYTVNTTNAIFIVDGATTTIASIAAGDTIIVMGKVEGNIISATRVSKGSYSYQYTNNNGKVVEKYEFQVSGQVTAINSANIELFVVKRAAQTGATSTTNYTIDASNAVFYDHGATTTIASIVAGDNITVSGQLNGTTIVASRIIEGQLTASNNYSSGVPAVSYSGSNSLGMAQIREMIADIQAKIQSLLSQLQALRAGTATVAVTAN